MEAGDGEGWKRVMVIEKGEEREADDGARVERW